MICIMCNTDSLKTMDTFSIKDITYRRKKCTNCNKIFYTKEVLISDDSGRNKFRLKSAKYDKKPV